MTRRNVAKNALLGPVKPFRPRGQSGLEISEFLPHIAECADDLFVIRSMHGARPRTRTGLEVPALFNANEFLYVD